MEEREETGAIQFPVDLNKKEYIAYYRLLDRITGANRRRWSWGGVISAWMLVELLLVLRDPAATVADAALYAGMLLLTLLYMLVVVPLLRGAQAGRTFDAATTGGQVFFGIFTLTQVTAVKETKSGRFEIPLNHETLFVETEQMQCFVSRGSRAIVLPARCLTPEDADAVRTRVTAVLPPENCRLIKPVAAERDTRMERQAEPETLPPLMSIRVTYRAQELKRLMQMLRRRSLFSSFLFYVPIAFVVALLFGAVDGFVVGAIAFWGIFGISLLISWLGMRRKYPVNIDEPYQFSFLLQFTDEALVVDGGAENGKAVLPWSRVSHAVEGEDSIEFYNRRQYIYVPKRCVEDMEECRRIVDRCRHKDAQ